MLNMAYSKTSLSEVNSYSLMDDGDFTADQIAEFREVFNWFDKDKDNFLNGQEVGDAMRALGENPTEAELREIIESIRITQDFLISRYHTLSQTHGPDIPNLGTGLIGPHNTRPRNSGVMSMSISSTMQTQTQTFNPPSINTNYSTINSNANIKINTNTNPNTIQIQNENNKNIKTHGKNIKNKKQSRMSPESQSQLSANSGSSGNDNENDNDDLPQQKTVIVPSQRSDSDLSKLPDFNINININRLERGLSMQEKLSYKIDFSQFLIMMAHKMRNPTDELEVKEGFKLLCNHTTNNNNNNDNDDNDNEQKIDNLNDSNNVCISKEKLIKIMTTMGEPMTNTEIMEILNQIGVNNNGQINYEQLIQFVL